MLLTQIEIFVFFLSGSYILFFFGDKAYSISQNRKQKIENKKEIIKERIKKRSEKQAQDGTLPKNQFTEINDNSNKTEDYEKLREIIKRVQVNISRGYLDSARLLIIEGLALHKNNKDLNLLLADIYEREKKYQNAEYIYRDLLDVHNDDDYILQRLGNIYTLRGKLNKSFDCYKRALNIDRSNTDIMDILAHLAIDMGEYKKALKYSTLFLKERPRDAEKLGIKGYSLEKLGKKSDAIKAYRGVLDMQPYNNEVAERVKKLEKNN